MGRGGADEVQRGCGVRNPFGLCEPEGQSDNSEAPFRYMKPAISRCPAFWRSVVMTFEELTFSLSQEGNSQARTFQWSDITGWPHFLLKCQD
jgi:hypothetical protein